MTVPGKILDILLYVLFSSTDLPTTVMACLYLAGLWAVFVKCGLKGWWALIPVARIYKLALCADREQEGRTLSVIQAVLILGYTVTRFLGSNSRFQYVVALVNLIFVPASLIYEVRVFSGLCRVFERRKRWILLWIIAEWVPVAPLLWGFRKK